MTHDTEPQLRGGYVPEPHVLVEASYHDNETGALYIHHDLDEARADWATEEHIRPPAGREKLGDAESFAAYVLRYGYKETTHITWCLTGIRATLDYHARADDGDGWLPGRTQWYAELPFAYSRELKAWMALCDRQVSQRDAIEHLEELAADIVDPAALDLIGLLRQLRSFNDKSASIEINEDGSTTVRTTESSAVTSLRSGAGALIPHSITIAIPILADAQARTMMTVLVRPSVNDQGRMSLRFKLVDDDRVFLQKCREAAVEASTLIEPEGFTIIRAAD